MTIENKFQCFVLTEVTRKNIIVIILENTCIEIAKGQYIDFTIKKKKTSGVHKLLAICENVF